MKDRSQTLMKQEQQQRKESGRIRYWHVICVQKKQAKHALIWPSGRRS